MTIDHPTGDPQLSVFIQDYGRIPLRSPLMRARGAFRYFRPAPTDTVSAAFMLVSTGGVVAWAQPQPCYGHRDLHSARHDREAFAHVATIRSVLLPYQLFIQHIDEHFGLNGKLVELAKEHRRIARTVVPSA